MTQEDMRSAARRSLSGHTEISLDTKKRRRASWGEGVSDGIALAMSTTGVRMRDMQVASGKVINGRVVVEAELPEGADVMLLALDGEETFEVDEELKALLLESIAQADRGQTITAEELIRELRDRE